MARRARAGAASSSVMPSFFILESSVVRFEPQTHRRAARTGDDAVRLAEDLEDVLGGRSRSAGAQR